MMYVELTLLNSEHNARKDLILILVFVPIQPKVQLPLDIRELR